MPFSFLRKYYGKTKRLDLQVQGLNRIFAPINPPI
jgi:hypothetical protein